MRCVSVVNHDLDTEVVVILENRGSNPLLSGEGVSNLLTYDEKRKVVRADVAAKDDYVIWAAIVESVFHSNTTVFDGLLSTGPSRLSEVEMAVLRKIPLRDQEEYLKGRLAAYQAAPRAAALTGWIFALRDPRARKIAEKALKGELDRLTKEEGKEASAS